MIYVIFAVTLLFVTDKKLHCVCHIIIRWYELLGTTRQYGLTRTARQAWSVCIGARTRLQGKISRHVDNIGSTLPNNSMHIFFIFIHV